MKYKFYDNSIFLVYITKPQTEFLCMRKGCVVMSMIMISRFNPFSPVGQNNSFANSVDPDETAHNEIFAIWFDF